MGYIYIKDYERRFESPLSGIFAR